MFERLILHPLLTNLTIKLPIALVRYFRPDNDLSDYNSVK